VHSILVLVLIMIVAVGFAAEVLMFKGVGVGDMHVCLGDEVVEGVGGVRPWTEEELAKVKPTNVVREFIRKIVFKVVVVFKYSELGQDDKGAKIRSDEVLMMSLSLLYTKVLVLGRHVQLVCASRITGYD
jgi:hypothetical protein